MQTHGVNSGGSAARGWRRRARLVVWPALAGGLLAVGLLAALAIMTPAAPVAAGNGGAYAYSVSSFDQMLRVINVDTARSLAGIPIQLPGFTVRAANGLAQHPGTGDLYAVLQLADVSGRSLVRLDPATGVATLVGHTGLPIATLAFGADGTLYAASGEGGPANTRERLFTLSLTTGAPTEVLVMGNGSDGEALGFNPDDGRMYHLSGRGSYNNWTGKTFDAITLTNYLTTTITLTGPAALSEEATAMLYLGGGVFLAPDIDLNWARVTVTGAQYTTTANLADHIAKGLVWAEAPPATACRPHALYGVAHNDYWMTSLYSVDPHTGHSVLAAPVPPLAQAYALEMTTGGTLYLVDDGTTGEDNLYQVDPCTGALTTVGPLSPTQDLSIVGLAAVPETGRLYAVDGSDRLHLIDGSITSTISSTIDIGVPLVGGATSLALGPSGEVYLTDQARLLTLDAATGLTLTAPVALTYTSALTGQVIVHGLDLNPLTGELLAVLWNNTGPSTPLSYLARLNPATGELTLLGQTVAWMESLAFGAKPAELYLPLVIR
jgi:hypothetical protein